MERWTGFLNPGELPEGLEEAIGEVQAAAECPGVFYACTRGDGRHSGTEFYLVERATDSISAKAKTYGMEILECPQYLLYPMDQERQVHCRRCQ